MRGNDASTLLDPASVISSDTVVGEAPDDEFQDHRVWSCHM